MSGGCTGEKDPIRDLGGCPTVGKEVTQTHANTWQPELVSGVQVPGQFLNGVGRQWGAGCGAKYIECKS